MAEIIYRLPGREQYSYAEVKFSADELFGPDALSGEDRVELLQTALADLNQTYPQSAAPVGAVAPQAAPATFAGDPRTTCAHGDRKHAKGQSAKGPWQAYFCSQPKGSQCAAVWIKQGESGWVY